MLVPSAIAFFSSAAACSSSKRAEPTPAFRESVASIVQAKCAECHSGDAPAGGWRATTYMDVIGCVGSDGAAATVPRQSTGVAPILSALDTHTHQGGLPFAKRLTDDERDVLTRWVQAGAPAWRSAVHDASFVDPRSPNHHSKWLRARKWQPMLDANYQPAKDPDANGVVDPGPCGQCHAGLSAAATPGGPDAEHPDRVKAFAPAATACTSCHNKPGGVFACTTCHGSGTKPYGLRDACFHPPGSNDPTELATATRESNHDAHVLGGSNFMNASLQCNACHAVPGGDDVLNGTHGGTHGNGQIDVILAPGVTGVGSSWDPTTKKCSNRCHAAFPDAARPTPSFDDTAKIKCGDCHGVPPKKDATDNHYLSPDGTCTFCHKEVVVAADGTKSIKQPFSMHLDGKIEKGDGSGRCNACHGNVGVTNPTLNDYAPTSGAHTAHLHPSKLRTDPIPCETCHVIPGQTDKHPLGDTGHGHVKFSGLALANGFAAKPYEPTGAKTCTVYCHSAIPIDPAGKFAAAANPTPMWTDKDKGSNCGACHGVPPPNHFTVGTCGVGACHGGILNPAASSDLPPTLTDAGKAVHINGAVNPALP